MDFDVAGRWVGLRVFKGEGVLVLVDNGRYVEVVFIRTALCVLVEVANAIGLLAGFPVEIGLKGVRVEGLLTRTSTFSTIIRPLSETLTALSISSLYC